MSVIKEQEWKECKKCGSRKLIKHEEYGCDNCKKPINTLWDKDKDYLKIDVFRHELETEQKTFCCWKCALEYLSTVESDYFVSLPYISFDNATPGCTDKDFFEAIGSGWLPPVEILMELATKQILDSKTLDSWIVSPHSDHDRELLALRASQRALWFLALAEEAYAMGD
jgi:hypothetical protein